MKTVIVLAILAFGAMSLPAEARGGGHKPSKSSVKALDLPTPGDTPDLLAKWAKKGKKAKA